MECNDAPEKLNTYDTPYSHSLFRRHIYCTQGHRNASTLNSPIVNIVTGAISANHRKNTIDDKHVKAVNYDKKFKKESIENCLFHSLKLDD